MIPLFCCCLTTNIPKTRKTDEMVSTRLNIFLLMLILLLARNSSALMEKTEEPKGDGLGVGIISLVNINKEISGVVPAAMAADEEGSNRRLKGRKMMLKWAMKKEMKEEDLDIEKRKTNSGCKHRRNGKCKFMNSRISSQTLKEKMVDFTAFSADYHVPKSHPPKHN